MRFCHRSDFKANETIKYVKVRKRDRETKKDRKRVEGSSRRFRSELDELKGA